MDTAKELIRTKSFWVFIVVAILGGIEAVHSIPLLGLGIAAITILGISLQGVESVLTERRIEQARNEAATQYTVAMQEITQARGKAATQHTEALHEIEQARAEAAKQNTDALAEIQKARDEARAENILLEAKRFATSLMEKDARVNQAVAVYPDFKQREWRELGLEMSAAVVGNVDFIKQMYLRAAGYPFDPPYSVSRLDDEERAYFTDHAILYLTETVLHQANQDAQGLLYLACMYGCRRQYDDMIMILVRAAQISQIVQAMKAEFRERPMMLILLVLRSLKVIAIETWKNNLSRLSRPICFCYCF